jgi:tetratricopeptide (TPR) repeat protein
MARAAAKRNQGAKKAARAVAADDARVKRKKAEKSLEDELFFNRLRGHAKWAFGLLAVVFGMSFVFLGVGSGNAGLGDVFSNVFGGGSAPTIESLQKKLAASPGDKTILSDLAQALDRDGRTDEAIAAYQTYLSTHPKDADVLANLALFHQTRAAAAANDANIALRSISLAAPGAQFQPGGTGVLGKALGSFVDPLTQAASTDAEASYREAVSRFQAANREALGVYKRLAALSPNDSSALLRYAQAAEASNNLKAAIAVYTTFVKRFPDDQLASDARKKIRELKQQQASSIELPTG